MKPARVSHETDTADIGIYGRLLEWGCWAKDRRHITERRDDVAGDFRITETIKDRLVHNRQSWFPHHVEAIDKAVASLKVEHDDRNLYYLITQYFLDWKTVEAIARDEDLSEFHVTEDLQRAMRLVASRLPVCEARVKAGR